MKRILCLMLCGMVLLGLAACGEAEAPAESSASAERSEAAVESGAESSEASAESETSAESSEEPVAEDPINILFLGNSFTYYNDLPAVFDSICKSAGKNVNVDSVTVGSARLDWFVTSSEAVCKTLNDKLSKQTFDYVFLQEHSTRPYKEYARFSRGAVAVLEKIRKSSPDCKPILYETWGFHDENSSLTEQGMTSKEQELLLIDAYEKLGGEMGAEISYAGVSFYRVYRETSADPYGNDLKHPSYAGTYTAALTHFYMLFPDAKQDDVQFDGEVDAETAKAIRAICYEVAHAEDKKAELEAKA